MHSLQGLLGILKTLKSVLTVLDLSLDDEGNHFLVECMECLLRVFTGTEEETVNVNGTFENPFEVLGRNRGNHESRLSGNREVKERTRTTPFSSSFKPAIAPQAMMTPCIFMLSKAASVWYPDVLSQ